MYPYLQPKIIKEENTEDENEVYEKLVFTFVKPVEVNLTVLFSGYDIDKHTIQVEFKSEVRDNYPEETNRFDIRYFMEISAYLL